MGLPYINKTKKHLLEGLTWAYINRNNTPYSKQNWLYWKGSAKLYFTDREYKAVLERLKEKHNG